MSLKNKFSIIAFFIVSFLFTEAKNCIAQSDAQLWIEYKPTIKFQKGFKLGMRASYRTNFIYPHWNTTELSFMPEKKFSKHLNGLLIFQTLHTLQTQSLTTNEIRPAIGSRIHFTPERRIGLDLLARFEYRFVHDNESDSWNNSPRIRLKVSAEMPFNHKRMKGDKIIYGRIDFEAFMIQSDDIKEVYSNRYWFDTTLGYKFNNKHKLELVYTLQDSKKHCR